MQPTSVQPVLTLRLFGAFEAFVGDAPLRSLRTRKGQWLLALLALRQGREVPRAWLASTLWAESGESQAYASLRKALGDLRDALGVAADVIESPSQSLLRLDTTRVWVDVAQFDLLVRRDDMESTEEAVDLYRGPMLDGCVEEWVLPEREPRRDACLSALGTLANAALAGNQASKAITFLRRAVTLEPWRESAHRTLLEALAATGDYAAVTAVYRELRVRLRNDLNTEPARETQELYARLRTEGRTYAVGKSVTPSLIAPSLPENRDEGAPTVHLPRPVSPLIGRTRELAEIASTLTGVRLLTLTGTGGVGKTRLALQAAENVIAAFTDGVFFADLTQLQDPALLPAVVASALEVAEVAGQPITTSLIESVRSRRLLLVMDNCEHLPEVCAKLTAYLLQGCPYLRIMATSRQPLGVPGEVIWQVSPLGLPAVDRLPVHEGAFIEKVGRSEAVAFFNACARAAAGSFTLDAGNVDAVLRICRCLDGIPLALELAAARVRALTPTQIAARLEDHFRLLENAAPALSPRQTLRGTMDWSYALLSPAEQILLRRLSVFAGGWTLETAELVCGGPGYNHIADTEPIDVLTLLLQLVDKSLVVVEDSATGRRYRLLEMVRRYAEERLEESGEAEALRQRHGDWCVRLAQEAMPHLDGYDGKRWLDLLDTEHGNLRQALRLTGPNAPLLPLVCALWRFWERRGHFVEGRSHLERALAASDPDVIPLLYGRALYGLSTFIWRQGEAALALTTIRRSLQLFEAIEELPWMARANNVLGAMTSARGEADASLHHLNEALRLFESLNDRRGAMQTKNNLGVTYRRLDNLAEARTHYTSAAEEARELGDLRTWITSLGNLAEVAYLEGDNTTAESLWRTCLEHDTRQNYNWGVASTLSYLGYLALRRGDLTEAESLLTQSLLRGQHLADVHLTAQILEGFAVLALRRNQPERAARLLAGTVQLRAEMESAVLTTPLLDIEAEQASLRDALGETAYKRVWEEGSAVDRQTLLKEALALSSVIA